MTSDNSTIKRTERKEPAPPFLKLAYRNRGLLVGLPVIFAIFWRGGEYPNELATWVAASVIFAVGLWIRIWAQQHLHFRLKVGMSLTSTGPYALMRNPIYIGNTLICIGLVVASGLLWLVPIMLLVCMLTFTFVVRFEELYLLARYGEPYVEYMKEIPRWLPKWPKGYKPAFVTEHLKASVATEAYNLLFLIPFILKSMLLGR